MTNIPERSEPATYKHCIGRCSKYFKRMNRDCECHGTASCLGNLVNVFIPCDCEVVGNTNSR